MVSIFNHNLIRIVNRFYIPKSYLWTDTWHRQILLFVVLGPTAEPVPSAGRGRTRGWAAAWGAARSQRDAAAPKAEAGRDSTARTLREHGVGTFLRSHLQQNWNFLAPAEH